MCMLDVFYILLAVTAFGGAVLAIRGCERI